MEGERKMFNKKLIFCCIFLNNKKGFPLHIFAKFFLPNPDACDLQPAVSNFAAHWHEVRMQQNKEHVI